MKKLLSVLLGFILAFSLSVPQLAYGEESVKNLKPPEEGGVRMTLITIQKYEAEEDAFRGVHFSQKSKLLHLKEFSKEYLKGSNLAEPRGGSQFAIFKVKDRAALKEIPKDLEYEDIVKNGEISKSVKKYFTGECYLTEKTNNLGRVNISLPDGDYWIVDKDRPSKYKSQNVESKAISLPRYNKDLGISKNPDLRLYRIYLYKVDSLSSPELWTTVENLEDKWSTHTEGEKFSWYLHARLDKDFKRYNKLVLRDEFNEAITLSKKNSEGVKNSAGKKLDDKIKIDEKIDEKIDKKINEKIKKYLGEISEYRITLKVKRDIKGVKDPEIIKLKEGRDFLVSSEATGVNEILSIDFTEDGLEKLKEESESGDINSIEIVAAIESKINDKAIMGREIPNRFSLEYGRNEKKNLTRDIQVSDVANTVTGGVCIEVVDQDGKVLVPEVLAKAAKDDETKPYTAVFQLIDHKAIDEKQRDVEEPKDEEEPHEEFVNLYLKLKEGTSLEHPTWEWTEDSKQAIRLPVDEKGTLTIKGIPLSGEVKDDKTRQLHNYELVEVSQPKGYQVVEGKTFFEVSSTSLYKDPNGKPLEQNSPITIINKKDFFNSINIGHIVMSLIVIALLVFGIFTMYKKKQA